VTDSQQLIADLDHVYQSTLDRLASQARDAHMLDLALRRILDQEDDDARILDWDVERAMSPRTAFRALAMKLVEHLQGSVQREIALSPIDYEDLLTWPLEPRRLGVTPVDDFLHRVQRARQYRLADFWVELTNRVTPHLSPDSATKRAGTDLAIAFVRELPHTAVIPVRNVALARTLGLPIQRQDQDPDWILPAATLHLMTRANHALSTVAELGDQGKVARHIRECTSVMAGKVKAAFRQYEPKDSFHAGVDLTIELSRDCVDYRLSPRLFELAQAAIKLHQPSISFLPSHQLTL
jgi:hypothetical protein